MSVTVLPNYIRLSIDYLRLCAKVHCSRYIWNRGSEAIHSWYQPCETKNYKPLPCCRRPARSACGAQSENPKTFCYAARNDAQISKNQAGIG